MKKNNNAAWMRSMAAFCLMVTLFLTTSMIALAKPGSSLAGEIIVSGQMTDGVEPAVMLNGEQVFSGRTFFESGVISTSDKASATVKLGKLGHVSLAPNSAVSLSFTENSISGTVLSGDVKVFNNEGVNVNVTNAASASKQQTNTGGNSILVPALIFSAIVGVAVIYVLTNGDDDAVVSPAR